MVEWDEAGGDRQERGDLESGGRAKQLQLGVGPIFIGYGSKRKRYEYQSIGTNEAITVVCEEAI